jgi:hypothetical protein
MHDFTLVDLLQGQGEIYSGTTHAEREIWSKSTL